MFFLLIKLANIHPPIVFHLFSSHMLLLMSYKSCCRKRCPSAVGLSYITFKAFKGMLMFLKIFPVYTQNIVFQLSLLLPII